MAPNIIILILWTVDSADFRNENLDNKSQGLASCSASHLFTWLYLLVGYFFILLSLLVAVAIKTRKIRYSNFKDTKKVNALVFLLIVTYSFTLGYWMILQTIERGENQISRLVLHFGHLLIISECIGLLFVPKIYPPVKAAVTSYYNK